MSRSSEHVKIQFRYPKPEENCNDDTAKLTEDRPKLKMWTSPRLIFSSQLSKRFLWGLFILAFHCYLAYAIYFNHYFGPEKWQWCDGLGFLIIIVGLVYLWVLCSLASRVIQEKKAPLLLSKLQVLKRKLPKEARCLPYVVVLVAVAVFFGLDTAEDRRRLISASGILIFVVILALLSKHPRKIDWRQVTWGLGLQFVFALVILRWPLGKSVVDCVGHKIDRFLGFTNQGSSFVFGYLVTQKIFNQNVFANDSLAYNVTMEVNNKRAVPSVVVFSALSVIYFFSFIVNILFHYGVIQYMTQKIGLLLKATVGTSTVESMNAASNIFLGQAMAPLLIKPYLADLTLSEIHAVLTSGFSTIAGTVMAAYISFGVSPAHLLSASVMSAPAALASAKLLLPETEKKATKQE